MWARIYLTAVMQAETDRDMVRRHLASAQRERELTGSTAGFRPGMGVYHGNRFVRPTYAVTPENPVKD